MDNRGSKSTILNSIVIKEQRVDGSWSVKSNLTDLRCILKGFERNRGINHNFSRQMCWSSRVKIPFKQFRLYPVVSLRGYVSRWSDPLEAKWGEGKVKYSTSTSLCGFVNRPQSRSMHEISVNPGVWSGLIDGEGSFSIILVKDQKIWKIFRLTCWTKISTRFTQNKLWCIISVTTFLRGCWWYLFSSERKVC